MTRWVWPCLVVGSVLGLAVGFTDAGTAATAITACVHRVNQNVRIVSSPAECRSFETPVSWPIAGPQAMGIPGPAGPQGPQGEPGPPGPAGSLGVSVVDATGQKIGETIRLAGTSATVLLTLQGMTFPLDVTPQGFKGSTDRDEGNLIFVGSSTCTGRPYYANAPVFSPMTFGVVGPPGATLYIRDDARVEIPIEGVHGSQWVQSGTRWMCYSYYGWRSGSLIPVQQWFDLEPLFTPPFRVQ